MQGKYLIIVSLFFLGLPGCVGWINPYASDFTCPKTADGKCVSVSAAYEESLKKDPQSGGAGKVGRSGVSAYEHLSLIHI